MRITSRKICLNNELLNNIQIIDIYQYNKLRVDTLSNIMYEIRMGYRSKNHIYVYGYKYKNKHGWCGIITDKKFTKETYQKYVEALTKKYYKLIIYSLNGESLV